MRTRLTLILSAMLVAVLASLGVPLALTIAGAQTREVHLDRLGDAARFASLVPVDPTAVDGQALVEEIRRYDQVYRIQVLVYRADHTVRASSRAEAAPVGPGAEELVAKVLAANLSGRRPDAPGAIPPWDDRPVVVGEPLVVNGDVAGAVILISDSTALRHRILRAWVLWTAAELVALLAGVVVARRAARWVLRPVAELDDATHRIASGDLAARVPPAGGPPELRRLAASFNDMASHVQRSVETQQALVADASHQLRNPLNALLVRLDGLAMLPPGAPDAADAAHQAAEDGRHLAATLDQMLELARAEHGDRPRGRIDIAGLVARRCEVWSVVAKRRRIELVRTGAEQALGWHDESAVTGALDAVVDNALKFSPEGTTVTVAVGVERGADQGAIAVEVRDQGPGIEAEDVPRITDRFWRSRRHPNVPGSGLGLAIAATLLERGGGSLSVARPPDGGLAVTLRIPTAQDSPAQGLASR